MNNLKLAWFEVSNDEGKTFILDAQHEVEQMKLAKLAGLTVIPLYYLIENEGTNNILGG